MTLFLSRLALVFILGLTLLSSNTVFAEDSGADQELPTTITFPSEDGLEITADLYLAHEDAETPFVVLFHQAGWSRGEYLEIAPKLNRLGFNCMAIDQRSGGEVNGVKNETHARATAARKGTVYSDALPDMIAALRFAREHHAKGKILAWGSSYSSALVLKLGGDQPGLVDGLASFAPGEYFEKLGKTNTWIQDSAQNIHKPVFITSAKNEHGSWKPIFDKIPSKAKVSFLPSTDGNHGSRALWKQFEDSSAYWSALVPFLREHFLED